MARIMERMLSTITESRDDVTHHDEDDEGRGTRAVPLYSPVQFEITPTPRPYMGIEYRKVGKIKRVVSETSAMKRNEIQKRALERTKRGLTKRSEEFKKDYTRTLSLWHMELERNKNHRDPGMHRRTERILKFLDRLQTTDKFHFKETFFLDLLGNEYRPTSSEPMPQPHQKRPILKTRHSTASSSSTTTAPTLDRFKERARKVALAERFSECKRAAEVPASGYVYVKLFSDPYYRFLPPLSAASKNYTIRLAKLPHQTLRDEENWEKFLESLKEKPKPPPRKGPRPPNYEKIRENRMERLKRKLPVISIIPKWLQLIEDKDDFTTSRGQNRLETKGEGYLRGRMTPSLQLINNLSRPESQATSGSDYDGDQGTTPSAPSATPAALLETTPTKLVGVKVERDASGIRDITKVILGDAPVRKGPRVAVGLKSARPVKMRSKDNYDLITKRVITPGMEDLTLKNSRQASREASRQQSRPHTRNNGYVKGAGG